MNASIKTGCSSPAKVTVVPRIIALHGFLGTPVDFSPLALPNLYAPSIFRMTPGPLKTWAQRFVTMCPDKAILLGYSMGGRLALNAILEAPGKFSAAIILAAHPGLPSHGERIARWHHDREWAKKLENSPWNELMRDWNQLKALRSSRPRIPPEHEFCRMTLSRTMRYFSLAQQEYLIEKINALDIPILWFAPQQESSALKGLRFQNPYSQLLLIKNGGHRFLFEFPLEIACHIRHFLATLGGKCTNIINT